MKGNEFYQKYFVKKESCMV